MQKVLTQNIFVFGEGLVWYFTLNEHFNNSILMRIVCKLTKFRVSCVVCYIVCSIFNWCIPQKFGLNFEVCTVQCEVCIVHCGGN